MSAPETFPYNYFATEVAAPGMADEAPQDENRTSYSSHDTDEGQGDHDPRLDPSSARTQGQVLFGKREGLPTAKPNTFEKAMGNLEKYVGHHWNNPYLMEKGELRRSGVFAARGVRSRD